MVKTFNQMQEAEQEEGIDLIEEEEELSNLSWNANHKMTLCIV